MFLIFQDLGELPQDFHPTDIHWYPRGGGPTAGGGGKKGPSQSVSGGGQDLFLVASAEGKLQLMSGKNGRVEKNVEAHRGRFFVYIKAEGFYYVNYVNINHSVKNSTVDCKYLLYSL